MTETSTILVTDIVGSTEMRSRVGEDAAEQVRREHDALVRQTVDEHGGEVVKSLGDGVLARFPGAAEAVAAAVGIQQAADLYSTEHPDTPLPIRAGVSAGDVSLEDDDCFGTPVIEAARLCAKAAGGQILAAELVRMLARGRGGHAFNPLGPMELQGLPGAIAVDEVAWERLPIPRQRSSDDSPGAFEVPLPELLVAADRFPYAGRVAVRQRLTDAWKRSLAGHRQVALIAGEPGLGKTRLAAEVAREAHRQGAAALFGRADETLEAPYRLVSEPLAHLVAHCPTDLLAAHVQAHGLVLAQLVADLPALVGSDVPVADAERVQLFDAVVDLLSRVSRVVPVVLVLDDLHWADHASLTLLRHLVRTSTPMAMTVIGTYRDTDLSRTHPLSAVLADLRRERDVERIALSGLNVDEITQLMTLAGGDVLSESAVALAEHLAQQTGGNAFFVGEILVHLAESHVIYQQDGVWTTDAATLAGVNLPEGVREVVGRRLSDLDDEVNDVLHIAAVVGQEFDAAVVADVTGSDSDTVMDLLDEPVRRALVVESTPAGRFRFAHPLTRQTLYDELSLGKRARLHAKVAATMLSTGRGSLEERAHHALVAATPGVSPHVLDLALEAAQAAYTATAFEDSLTWCRRGLEVEELTEPRQPVLRSKLLVAFGTARAALGEAAEARADIAAAAALAREAGDVIQLGECAATYGHSFGAWLDYADAVALPLIEEAMRSVPDSEQLLRTRLQINHGSWLLLSPDGDERRRVAAAAVEFARAAGDDAVLLEALSLTMQTVRNGVDPREFDNLADEIDEIVRRHPSPTHEMSAHYLRARAAMRRGDIRGFAEPIRRSAELYRTAHAALARWELLTLSVTLNVMRGDFDNAWKHVELAERVSSTVGTTGRLVGLFQRLWLKLLERADDATDMMDELASEYPEWTRFVVPVDAQAAIHRGDMEAAARLAAEYVAALPFVPDIMRYSGLSYLTYCAPALTTDDAEMLFAQLEPARNVWLGEVEICHGHGAAPLARLAARLGRVEQADALWQEAITAHAQAGEVGIRRYFEREYGEWRATLAR